MAYYRSLKNRDKKNQIKPKEPYIQVKGKNEKRKARMLLRKVNEQAKFTSNSYDRFVVKEFPEKFPKQ